MINIDQIKAHYEAMDSDKLRFIARNMRSQYRTTLTPRLRARAAARHAIIIRILRSRQD